MSVRPHHDRADEHRSGAPLRRVGRHLGRRVSLVVGLVAAALLVPLTPALAAPTLGLVVVAAPTPAASGAAVTVELQATSSEAAQVDVVASVSPTSSSWAVTGIVVGGQPCPSYACRVDLAPGVPAAVQVTLVARAAPAVLRVEARTWSGTAPTFVDVPLVGLQAAPAITLSGPSAPVAAGTQTELSVLTSGVTAAVDGVSYDSPTARLLRRPAGTADWVVDQEVYLGDGPVASFVTPEQTTSYAVEFPGDIERLPARSKSSPSSSSHRRD